MSSESLWHITVLSNFARGYDKYARRYSKDAIHQSTFPDQFFLLRESELEVGIRKAGKLLTRLGLIGDRLLALRTVVAVAELRENSRSGVGRYVECSSISLDGVAWVDGTSGLTETSVEDAMAGSLQALHPSLPSFADLKPRSFSVLPIARGCQAACPFCFSDASASAEQDHARLDLARICECAAMARERGAGRFVITGGGEPGLVRHELLCEVVRTGSSVFDKTVLITNGHHLSRRDEGSRKEALADYQKAGLRVLAISRHHHDEDTSGKLMSLRTDVAAIARIWNANLSEWPMLRLRLICVLQRGGVDSLSALKAYVDWAASIGVREICFKELYVSTSIESVYHRHVANEWSHAHQVPLSLVLKFAKGHAFTEISRLPWGAPVFHGSWNGKPMQIAAYTEPSLLWELSHGVARSWNLMADGRCLVSLEDGHSEINCALTA